MWKCLKNSVQRKFKFFCELNAYKYKYRHELKNGQEDLDKAAWYEAKQAELVTDDARFKIARRFGLCDRENLMIEEMSELTQAICKCKRIRNYLSPDKGDKMEVVTDNLIEEIADVKLVLEQLIYLLGCENAVTAVENQKIQRTLERIGEQNENN